MHYKQISNPISDLGVNVAGYFKAGSGLGEGGRATVRALEAVDIPYVLNNCDFNLEYHNLDNRYKNFSSDNPHPVNIVQVNADSMIKFVSSFGRRYLRNRYNIGFWLWEMPRFPPEWFYAFDLFNEIWTPSSFCVESIGAVSPVPVIKIPLSIDLPIPTLNRADVGLPAKRFVFLFIFDFCSSYDRKNPEAVIRAFLQAFGRKNRDVALVIKSANAEFEKDKSAQMRTLAEGAENIEFINKNLPREEVNAMIYHSDCYVSLHRAEGFGLTPAEAMFYGKPVIATDYSATTDFINANNGFPVKYKLVSLSEDISLYSKGDLWAEADVEHAAQQMRFVFENQNEAKRAGQRAADDIRQTFAPQNVGQTIKNRLHRAANLQNGSKHLLRTNTIQEQFKTARAALEFKEAENNQLRERIRLMEESKFWKIRTHWFTVKRRLNLTRKF